MKTILWKGRAAIAFAGCLVLLLAGGAAAQTRNSALPQLQGTWAVTVTQQDCESGTQIGNPFLSLLTFAQGGTMTESTSNPMFYPAERGPGHGIWKQVGQKTYTASSIALITLNGALTTVQTISQTIQIGDDPDAFQTTKAKVKFLAPNGAVLRTGCAAAAGARFH
jgi:hypothetical protein